MRKSIFAFVVTFFVFLFSSNCVCAAESVSYVAPNGLTYKYFYETHRYSDSYHNNYDVKIWSNIKICVYDSYKFGDAYALCCFYDGEICELTGSQNSNNVNITTSSNIGFCNSVNFNTGNNSDVLYSCTISGGVFPASLAFGTSLSDDTFQHFSDVDEMRDYLQSEDEIVYTYDSAIGYLSDVKSKSVIFNLFDIDTINSDNPDNRVLRTSWGVNTSTGINVSSGRYNNLHTISPYSNFQIQAKIHGYGHVVNSWTKKILRDLPSEGSWVDLPSDIPANSYRYDLSFDSLVNKSIFGAGTGTSYPNDSPYFGSMIESANVGLNESLDLNFDLYFRIIADRVDDPVLNADVTTPVCGPWICVKYSNIDTEVPKISVVGGTLDDNNDFNVDTSSDNPYSSSQSVPISVGTGSSVDDAANSVVSPLSSPISGILSSAEDFMDLLIGMRTFMGSFPELFSTVFSFLPAYVLAGISGSILLIILMRFLGR